MNQTCSLSNWPYLQVLEWANDDISMEEKRRRSAAKYLDQENDTPKRRRTVE